LFSNIKFIVDSGLYLLPEVEQRMPKVNKEIKIGDLCYVGKKLCLVIDVVDGHAIYTKRVLLQWVGEDDHYWISYELFSSMVKDV